MKILGKELFQIIPADYRFGICIMGIYFYISKIKLRPAQKSIRKKELRERLLQRDGHRCQICGTRLRTDTLSVHHIKPRSEYPELVNDPANMTCLCRNCHLQLHIAQDRERAARMKRNRVSMHLTVPVNPCLPTLYEKTQGHP